MVLRVAHRTVAGLHRPLRRGRATLCDGLVVADSAHGTYEKRMRGFVELGELLNAKGTQ